MALPSRQDDEAWVSPLAQQSVENRVASKTFRLDRFSTASLGTIHSEADTSMLDTCIDHFPSCCYDESCFVAAGLGFEILWIVGQG